MVALASEVVGVCDFPASAKGAGGAMASKPDASLVLFCGEEGPFRGANEGQGKGS